MYYPLDIDEARPHAISMPSFAMSDELQGALEESLKNVQIKAIESVPVVGGAAAAFLDKMYNDEKEAKAA